MLPFSSVSRLVLASSSLAIFHIPTSYSRFLVEELLRMALITSASAWASGPEEPPPLQAVRSRRVSAPARSRAVSFLSFVMWVASNRFCFGESSRFSREEASSPAIWAGVLLPSFYRRRAGAVKLENYTNSAQKNCENKPENDDFLRTLQQTVRTSQRNFATGAAGAFRPPPDAPSAMRGSRPE